MTDETSRRAAAEHLALALTHSGMQRMAARVMAAFLFSDEPSVTAGDIGEELGASAGSISGAIKMLESVGLIDKVPVPGSRRDHYRMRERPWATLYTKQNAVIDVILQTTEKGMAAVDEDSPSWRRLQYMRDFYLFLFDELPALLERFEEGRT